MRAIGLSLAAGLMAGCGLLGIGTPAACPAALLEGSLVPHPRVLGGASVMTEFGVEQVLWPAGYTVSSVAGRIQLLDPRLRTVATEGEMIYVGGGMSPDNTHFVACGYVSNEPP